MQSHFQPVDKGLRHGKSTSAHSGLGLTGAALGQVLSVVPVSTNIRKGSRKNHLGRRLGTVSGKGNVLPRSLHYQVVSFIKPYIRYLSSFIISM